MPLPFCLDVCSNLIVVNASSISTRPGTVEYGAGYCESRKKTSRKHTMGHHLSQNAH